MQKVIFKLFLLFTGIVQFAHAQQYDSLEKVKTGAAAIYYSTGHQQRATKIATQLEKAMLYYQELLDYKLVVTLLILSPADWKKYTSMGAVYGMPHFSAKNKTLYVAAEDNAFWKSFLPPLDRLPAELSQQIQSVYKNAEGELSMEAFFDLLAIHELGHAFQTQANLTMQRTWMGELFVNILLHTYIAEKEPALLPALTLFPKMVIAGGSQEFKYTKLQDIEERYNDIARDNPKNYGWYQCRWHAAAGKIYDAAGAQVGKKIWLAFSNQKEKLTDKELITFLELHAHKSLAELIEKWDAGY